jgi:hypothetical protein
MTKFNKIFKVSILKNIMTHKYKHINDLVVQGQAWGPTELSKIKESKEEYSNRQYRSIKSMTPKQLIELCNSDGRFYLNEQHGKVLKVIINEDTLSFKKYVKKYSPNLQSTAVVMSIARPYNII